MRIAKSLIFFFLGISVVCAQKDTVITSDTLEMETLEDTHVFEFQGNVNLESAGLDATCNNLKIYAKKNLNTGGKTASFKGVDKIVATGNVVMKQDGRVVTAGYAEVYPELGKVVLEKNPQISDEEGVVAGHRITLYRDNESALIEGSTEGNERPKVKLKSMPKLGLKRSKVNG